MRPYPDLAVALLASLAPPAAWTQSSGTVQVNLTSTGQQPAGNSWVARISASGRYVAWTCGSTNVLPGLTNGASDVFVTDVETGSIELASAAFAGGDADLDSKWGVSLSSSGRLVAFHSNATNLLATPQSLPGIYVRDLDAGATERIDVSTAGVESNGASTYDVMISPDGRYVVFVSYASDLVAGLGNPGGWWQVYLRDRYAGVNELISANLDGKPGGGHSSQPAVTPGGRFVLFGSDADDLVAGDTNGMYDAFVRDRLTGTTERISVATGGAQGDGQAVAGGLSADGRFATFSSSASNLAAGTPPGVGQTYLRDRLLGATTLVSTGSAGPANRDADGGVPSPCGRSVLFGSTATNLWPGVVGSNSKVYERDTVAGTTRLVALNASGTAPVAYAGEASYSADRIAIAFVSKASNLTSVPDPNGNSDVFVQTIELTAPTAYCVAEVNSLGCTPAMGSSGTPSASAGSGFDVTSANALSQHAGLFFYSLIGPRLVPFQGGLRCVESPIRRTPLQSSGGSAAPDCSGVFTLDFNAWTASGADPALVAGQQVWGQWWSRDAASSFATNLSDASTFELGP